MISKVVMWIRVSGHPTHGPVTVSRRRLPSWPYCGLDRSRHIAAGLKPLSYETNHRRELRGTLSPIRLRTRQYVTSHWSVSAAHAAACLDQGPLKA